MLSNKKKVFLIKYLGWLWILIAIGPTNTQIVMWFRQFCLYKIKKNKKEIGISIFFWKAYKSDINKSVFKVINQNSKVKT